MYLGLRFIGTFSGPESRILLNKSTYIILTAKPSKLIFKGIYRYEANISKLHLKLLSLIEKEK